MVGPYDELAIGWHFHSGLLKQRLPPVEFLRTSFITSSVGSSSPGVVLAATRRCLADKSIGLLNSLGLKFQLMQILHALGDNFIDFLR